jgi:hypothetical protein
METKIKTYDDLLKDTENTWDFEESLEELLFEVDGILEEAISTDRRYEIVKGDIIMANNGVSQRELGMDVISPHRIFIIEDAVGDPGNRIFRGYLLSSKVWKANKNNENFPNNIYIEDYSTILARGPYKAGEVFLNLSDLYVIEESRMDISKGGFWKGHATQEFIHFIDTAIAAKNEGKPLTNYCWIDGRPTT